MANGITTAFWGVTINNYDDRDLAIMERGYPDYCREVVWTLEEGKEKGTPHIQAYVKLQRQQRLSFMKKIFPGGNFKPLTSAEYIHNTKKYCQKNDETTRSAHKQVFHDPIHTLETVCRRVGLKVAELQEDFRNKGSYIDWDEIKTGVEKDMVAIEDFRFAKVFVSATYKHMWKDFGVEMCIFFHNIHTHTHTQPREEVSTVDIPTTDAGDGEEGESGDEQGRDSEGTEDDEGESDSEGSGTETDSEGGDCGYSETDA